jgi:hypothetical protein
VKNKKIIILGGTGFVGHFLRNILDTSNHITYIGRSTQISYNIGQEVTRELKELISSSDVVIFASWNFYIEENSYVNIHVNSVVEILRLCSETKTSFLFISTFLANSASKSRYNKAKYLCEVECDNYSQSWIRLGVLLSDINEKGNLYLKLSNFPTFFGYKLMIKPNYKKFNITDLNNIRIFLDNFSFNGQNIFQDSSNSKLYSLTEILDIISGKSEKYFYINWNKVYCLFRALKILGISTRLNLDSLISIWGENLKRT